MCKKYEEPMLEIRNFNVLESEFVTTSIPETNDNNDLHKDDEYDYFG